jgi:hypothetical protein
VTDTGTKEAEERIRKLATEARTLAILGIFFLGILLGPFVLLRIASVRKRIKQTGVGESSLPHLRTSQQIAIAATIVWLVGPALKLAGAL